MSSETPDLIKSLINIFIIISKSEQMLIYRSVWRANCQLLFKTITFIQINNTKRLNTYANQANKDLTRLKVDIFAHSIREMMHVLP